MFLKKQIIIVLLVIAIPFLVAAFLYPSLPQQIPIHFNWKGEADGWGKRESIFLTPVILGFVSLFVYFLLSNLKRIDPLRYAKTEDGIFKKFSLVMVLFMTGLSLIILFTSVHPEVPVNKLILSFLGLGFGLMGFYMPKLQQNYFAGFRLPWTLSSTENWNATHKVAGKCWVWGGMAQMISAILLKDQILLIAFIAITFIIVIIPIIYSFRYFRKNSPLT